MNRRSFLQTALITTGAVSFLSTLQAAERTRPGSAAAGPVLADPKDAAAKAVHYVNDVSDMKDKTLQADRSGVKFQDQHCVACLFYDKTKEVTVGGKKAGPCSMPFAKGKVVAEKGWCSTWAKKA